MKAVKSTSTPRICPICGKSYTEYPALSRKDNRTEICPDCGQKEALKDLALRFRSGSGETKKNRKELKRR